MRGKKKKASLASRERWASKEQGVSKEQSVWLLPGRQSAHGRLMVPSAYARVFTRLHAGREVSLRLGRVCKHGLRSLPAEPSVLASERRFLWCVARVVRWRSLIMLLRLIFLPRRGISIRCSLSGAGLLSALPGTPSSRARLQLDHRRPPCCLRLRRLPRRLCLLWLITVEAWVLVGDFGCGRPALHLEAHTHPHTRGAE